MFDHKKSIHIRTGIILLLFLFFLSGCTAQKKEDHSEVPTEQTEEAVSVIEEESEAEMIPFAYQFQPHVISDEYIRAYGEEIEPLFYAFCDAVLNGESTFPCPSTEMFHQVLGIARVCLPVASYCIEEDDVYVKDGVGHIAYRMDQKELKQTVESFKARVTEVIKSAVPYQEEDFIVALELLQAVAKKDIVDEEELAEEGLLRGLSIMPYRAITENIGICQEIAGEYIYYLLQAGINATTCSALSRDKENAHMWVLMELDGEYYHVDPMVTIDYPDSPAFFGLTDVMREQYGDFPVEDFCIAESDALRREDYKAESERFLRLWRAESYRINRRERKLELTLFDLYAPETEDEFAY